MTKYILALDQGTTSSRAIIFDRDAHVVCTAQREFQQHYPQPGWVEHDPMEIFATQSAVMVEALAQAGPRAEYWVLIGPEGGFPPQEARLARQSGFTPCGLPGAILRAETASLAAAAVIRFGLG